MTPLRLTTWFRKRMLPPVAVSAFLVATAAPVGFHLQKRAELLRLAHGEAARAGEAVRIAIEERPRLWRYDAVKLGERLGQEGLDRLPLRIVSGGVDVGVERMHPAPALGAPLWGRFDVTLPDGDPRAPRLVTFASVWVAVDAAPLYAGTALLFALFTSLAILLGSVLYLRPVRAVRAAERRIHLLLGQLALALQEEDRRRIARDLHDGAGQAITAARLELLALTATAITLDPAALKRIASHLDEALSEVRRSTVALGPPALAELGLARALSRHAEAFADAAGLRVSCEVPADVPPLPAELELACYRIVQEALTNVARHARATRAWIRLSLDPARAPTLRLSVEDDGAGLGDRRTDRDGPDREGSDPRGGNGLDNIRERARLLGGEARLLSRESGGLCLEVAFPIRGAEAAWPLSERA